MYGAARASGLAIEPSETIYTTNQECAESQVLCFAGSKVTPCYKLHTVSLLEKTLELLQVVDAKPLIMDHGRGRQEEVDQGGRLKAKVAEQMTNLNVVRAQLCRRFKDGIAQVACSSQSSILGFFPERLLAAHDGLTPGGRVLPPQPVLRASMQPYRHRRLRLRRRAARRVAPP